MEKEELSKWMSDINKHKPPATKQKIVPIEDKDSKTKASTDEVQLSCYVEKGLMKSLKLRALKEEETIKYIINKSISLYLKSND